METARLIEIALLITVVIWMVITTLLFRSMQKSYESLKKMQVQVSEAQNDTTKSNVNQMETLAAVIDQIAIDINDNFSLTRKFMNEASENKSFAIKTVLRAQETLKKCNALNVEMQSMLAESIRYPSVNEGVEKPDEENSED